MPCRFCGQDYEAHRTRSGSYTPRMPCLGLRAHYLERTPQQVDIARADTALPPPPLPPDDVDEPV